MRIITLEQGSPDWLLWRQKGIGGSDAIHIVGGVPWADTRKLRGEKTGSLSKSSNAAMKHGRDTEPIARMAYTDLTGNRVVPLCVLHDDHDWLRASLDGISEDHDLILEVKSPFKPDNHEKVVISKQIPAHYYPQVQHQLLVTGASKAHFVSYSRHKRFRPRDRLVLVEVAPDPEYQKWYFERARNFWESLAAP